MINKKNFFLMCDVISAYFVAVCVLRTKSCNLHCNVFSHLFEVIVYNICLNVNQNTDFTAHMSIRSNETVLLFYLLETTDVHVLTNDGDLINAMMRGANRHEKEYIVKTDREITPDFLEKMAKGIYLKDLDITTRECEIEQIGKFTFRIVLTQGVNRQIRRMCEACGYRVKALKRIRIMNILLGDLKPGKWREITGEELEQLQRDTGMLNRN